MIENHINELVSAIIGLVGGGSCMYYAQEKRAKILANEATQSEEWRKLYEEQRDINVKKDEKIAELEEKITELNQEMTDMMKKIAALEVMVTKLTAEAEEKEE